MQSPNSPKANFKADFEHRRLLILGSTGSIGQQTLELVARFPERFSVVGLSAGRNRELLREQGERFGVPASARVLGGVAAGKLVEQVEADLVLNGIAGAAGLPGTVAALKRGRLLALANKESLVIGGQLVVELAGAGQIIPVDSEHSALAQALRSGGPDAGTPKNEVAKLILTASGGPFVGYSTDQLAKVTPEQALQHPTWDMGRLVTTNSATLVNKGLEVIEAHLLFGVPYSQIEVVVHPQSVVHSLVEFKDGSTVAQLSPPDMRLPIAHALAWPGRLPGAARPVNWSAAHSWVFSPVNTEAFPALVLAREAGEQGGSYPAVLNAANEVAVEAFHQRRISFPAIANTIAATLESFAATEAPPPGSIAEVLEADSWARQQAAALLPR